MDSYFTADNESLQFLSEEEIEAPKLAMHMAMQAKQLEIGIKAFLRRVYHLAPDDVFEKIVSICMSWEKARCGKSIFKLVNKRLALTIQGLEERATRLTEIDEPFYQELGPKMLPVNGLKRCKMIERIKCSGTNLRSLKGCPDRLKHILIGHAHLISDLSHLASCSKMESLMVADSVIKDISAVASMSILEVFACTKHEEGPSISLISPLSSCLKLSHLSLNGNYELDDLSPLLPCTSLEQLHLSGCSVSDLSPLSQMKNLRVLNLSYNEGFILTHSPLCHLV
jgi:hypothetical protein